MNTPATMRGFSNRQFARSDRPERLLELLQKPHLPDLDFSRYAPVTLYEGHPKDMPKQLHAGLVSEDAPIKASWRLAMASFAQAFRCLWNIVLILLLRARLRLLAGYHTAMQSLHISWSLAGSGWGVAIGMTALMVLR